jgi:hypothetical protein
MFAGYLCEFQKSDLSIIVDQGTSLDIGHGLVGDFHNKLGIRIHHVVKDLYKVRN